MILHTLNKTEPKLLRQLCAASEREDAVLLIEDGVYHAMNSAALAQLAAHARQVFALEDDVLARGITPDDTVTAVSYTRFVELASASSKVVSWY